MRRSILALCAISIVAFVPRASLAQSAPFPTSKWFQEVVKHPLVPSQLAGPEHLRDYVVDGKLRLSLDQAIQLALANNTNIRIDELTYQGAWYSVLAAHSPFDPIFTSNFTALRSTTPTGTSQLAGVTALNTSSLSQSGSISISQFFPTGTTVTAGTSASRFSDINSAINPAWSPSLNLFFNQPLLKNRGLFINRAPIVIAQRGLQQSRDNFESQVSSIIQNVVSDYWFAVLQLQTLIVDKKAVDQAQASYDHDKRALELGALPPYDIYRTESELASRKVTEIQQEYSLKEAEDSLRDAIGADLDSNVGALDLDLTEHVEPVGELLAMDINQAIQTALKKRPELEVERLQLDIDDINIRVAHNQMQPDLELQGTLTSNGLGGNLFTQADPPVLIAPGGLGQAFSQVGQFQFPTYSASLTLSLPIRNRAAEAAVGSSQVNKKRDLFSQRAELQSIELEARNAIHSLEQAKLSMSAAKIARDLTQKNLDAEQRKFDLGVETLFVLLDTQTELATADLALVNAQISYQIALTAVQHATGELLERYHVQIKDAKPPFVP
ncbi:MAG TPA: TolC family protein [Candidatus Acidoferrales bacterium]|jgi:outer membrane protein